MSANSIHIQCENPELLIEFDLPPGTHATIGASPRSEITLPLGGIPPFCCILGRFHDGRLYLANLDETISRRLDLPDLLSIPPYEFVIFQPEELVETTPEPHAGSRGKRRTSAAFSSLTAIFRKRKSAAPKQHPPPVE